MPRPPLLSATLALEVTMPKSRPVSATPASRVMMPRPPLASATLASPVTMPRSMPASAPPASLVTSRTPSPCTVMSRPTPGSATPASPVTSKPRLCALDAEVAKKVEQINGLLETNKRLPISTFDAWKLLARQVPNG